MTTHMTIQRLVGILTREKLIEDPNDFVANLVVGTAHRLSIHARGFAAIYLLAHGLIKLGLAIGLLRGVLWERGTRDPESIRSTELQRFLNESPTIQGSP